VLHVGVGTFRPLRDADLAAGHLHEERFELPDATAAAVARARERGGRVVAVGTTSARVLETCAAEEGRVRAARGATDLFLRPGSRFRVVDALLTNFHLPRSSLLLLVAAFAGRERVLAAYAEAIARGYRFYSYGDAMWIA
jgi:S-adenosylmethionine:tRNA ribosyltransferase-isomerase